jgi:dTDP-4-dehydrorhamnose 3,5-epimerase-like enzyme
MAALKTGARLLLPTTSGHDARGSFSTLLTPAVLAALDGFVPCRDYRSVSRAGVVRGMHYQPGLAKLVRCSSGAIADYIVDMRERSFGVVDVVHLTCREDAYLYVPPWCAHGYAALVDAEVGYLFNDEVRETIRLLWSSIDAAWPFRHPILSALDAEATPLDVFRAEGLTDAPR